MRGFVSDQIQVVKDVVEGSDSELERDWPYYSFKEILTEILINLGVLHHDATSEEQEPVQTRPVGVWQACGVYAEHDPIQCWLQISAVVRRHRRWCGGGSLCAR